MVITKLETNFRRKLFFHKTEALKFDKDFEDFEFNVVNLYPTFEFQEILGFGGAFTEAAASSLSCISERMYDEIMNSYFSKSGLNYNFCRTHIGSCDFSLDTYAYSNQSDLSDFSIQRDMKYLIPMIRYAKNINKDLKLLASPWSPPAFMKDNNQMVSGGKLLKDNYILWAKYLVKYIEAYSNENIKFDFMTAQNEPRAIQTWESCIYTAEEESDLVNNYIIPLLNKENIKTKMLIWDQNKERLFFRASKILENKSNQIAGIACHWYTGDHFENIQLVHELYPDKLLIHTEGCTGYSKFKKSEEVKNAEIYAHDIIGDLNSGINAFIDWNLVLDYNGGPNHKKNFCNAPIMLNKHKDGFIKSLTYYYIGHFSKYILPGAKRIGYSKFSDKIEMTAFKNIDNSVVVVLLNKTDTSVEYNLNCNDKVFHDNLDKHAIVTLNIK